MESLNRSANSRGHQLYGAPCYCGFLRVIPDDTRHGHFGQDFLRDYCGIEVCLNERCRASPLHPKREANRLLLKLKSENRLCKECDMLQVTILAGFKTVPRTIVRAYEGKTICINPACAQSPLAT